MSLGVPDAYGPPSTVPQPHSTSVFPSFETPSGELGAGRGDGLLTRHVPPHLAHPALHLLAEVVIPAAVSPDFSTVFTSAHLVALPVVWLGGRPVLVALLIVGAVHPSPGALTVGETYPGIEGVGVL